MATVGITVPDKAHPALLIFAGAAMLAAAGAVIYATVRLGPLIKDAIPHLKTAGEAGAKLGTLAERLDSSTLYRTLTGKV